MFFSMPAHADNRAVCERLNDELSILVALSDTALDQIDVSAATIVGTEEQQSAAWKAHTDVLKATSALTSQAAEFYKYLWVSLDC